MSASILDSSTALRAGLTAFFNSGTFSDVIVCCQGDKYHLHKVILCSQSKFFMKAFMGGFKEAESGIIELEDDDPAVVRAVLQYLYGFDYADGVNLPMVFIAQVYALADKYDIAALKTHAMAKFKAVAKAAWNTSDFSHSIRVIYESTLPNDQGLRDVALRLAVEKSDALLEDNEAFQKITGEVGDSKWDLAHEIKIRLEEQKRQQEQTDPSLVCFQCFGDLSLPIEQRTKRYKRVQYATEHFKNEHLKNVGEDGPEFCNYCNMELEHKMHFQRHAYDIHKICS